LGFRTQNIGFRLRICYPALVLRLEAEAVTDHRAIATSLPLSLTDKCDNCDELARVFEVVECTVRRAPVEQAATLVQANIVGRYRCGVVRQGAGRRWLWSAFILGVSSREQSYTS